MCKVSVKKNQQSTIRRTKRLSIDELFHGGLYHWRNHISSASNDVYFSMCVSVHALFNISPLSHLADNLGGAPKALPEELMCPLTEIGRVSL